MINKEQILESISFANERSNLPEFIQVMDGMSTQKTRSFFNKMGSYFNNGDNYLEVGCWKCATFCSTLWNNNLNGIAIDNFSQFQDIMIYRNPDQVGHPKEVSRKNVANLLAYDRKKLSVKMFNHESFSFDLNNLPKIDFYFYDGCHSEESQYMAYKYYNPVLSDTFLTVVDDWSDGKDTAAKGTRRAFKHLGYNVKFEVELPASKNSLDPDGWWNGLYIAIIEK